MLTLKDSRIGLDWGKSSDLTVRKRAWCLWDKTREEEWEVYLVASSPPLTR